MRTEPAAEALTTRFEAIFAPDDYCPGRDRLHEGHDPGR